MLSIKLLSVSDQSGGNVHSFSVIIIKLSITELYFKFLSIHLHNFSCLLGDCGRGQSLLAGDGRYLQGRTEFLPWRPFHNIFLGF